MLAIVEHEQEPSAGQRIGHAFGGGGSGANVHTCCRGNGGGDQAGIGQRRKLGEPNAVGEFRPQLARDRQGESCLADTAGAGQGDKPMPDVQG